MSQINLFWFRRDLRLTDNHGLDKALNSGKTLCCFIFDQNILENIKPDDPKIDFMLQSVKELKANLIKHDSDLLVLHGDPRVLIPETVRRYSVKEVFANEDYEPAAILRDKEVANLLNKDKIKLSLYQDQVIFAKDQLLTKDGTPYMGYTPYKNAWLSELDKDSHRLAYYPSAELLPNLYPYPRDEMLDIVKLYGFTGKSTLAGGEIAARNRLAKFMDKIDDYAKTKDISSLDSTSYLGADLCFGTISIRNVVKLVKDRASNGSEIWLDELIWREFFSQILYNFPHVERHLLHLEYGVDYPLSIVNRTKQVALVRKMFKELET